MEKLTEMLNNVPDSYYDFVAGVLNYAKRSSNNLSKITTYIERHPGAGTSEILDYMLSQENYYEHAQRIVGVAQRMQIHA